MRHYGDITKIDGHKVPLVDIVTGGSPCQDLSVAGKRAGLDGARSGLFMEQIRIIKEMRNESAKQLRSRGTAFDIRYIQPRYMVWENVPGAFSSNKGEDFRAVLEETAKIVCEDAVIPRPERGKWTPSGCIMGDGWSIAWRLHDAQFWGVPQRRKRIALVADFGGQSAPEILFESQGLSGDSETSREEGQGASIIAERNADPSSYTLKIRGGVEVDSHGKKAGKGPLIQTELSGTLGVSQDQTLITKCLNPWDVQSKHIQPENGVAEALYAGECRYGGGESYVAQKIFSQRQKVVSAQGINGDIAGTLDASYYKGCGERQGVEREVVYGIDRASFNQGQNAQYDFCVTEEQAQTLVAKGPGGVLATNQAIGEYKITGVASSLKQRDYKDATDLVISQTTEGSVKNGK